MLTQTRQRIKIDTTYKIPACAGGNIAEARDVFSWVDPKYKSPPFNSSQESTSEKRYFSVPIPRHVSVKQAFFFEGINPQSICFTQSQIVALCRTNLNMCFLTRDLFFLLKEKENIWVANVSSALKVEKLFAYLISFDNGLISDDARTKGIILPKVEVLNEFFKF